MRTSTRCALTRLTCSTHTETSTNARTSVGMWPGQIAATGGPAVLPGMCRATRSLRCTHWWMRPRGAVCHRRAAAVLSLEGSCRGLHAACCAPCHIRTGGRALSVRQCGAGLQCLLTAKLTHMHMRGVPCGVPCRVLCRVPQCMCLFAVNCNARRQVLGTGGGRCYVQRMRCYVERMRCRQLICRLRPDARLRGCFAGRA